MPLALPPRTHPPKSLPQHQSAPVGKVLVNKTFFEQLEYNSDLYIVILNVIIIELHVLSSQS